MINGRVVTTCMLGLLVACGAGPLGVVGNCDLELDAGPVVSPEGCDLELDGTCWRQLGLDGSWVTAILLTDEALYVGTGSEGVFRHGFDTDGWRGLGLSHAAISSIVRTGTSPERILVGIKPRALGATSTGEPESIAAVFATENEGCLWRAADGGLGARHDNRYWAYTLATDPADPRTVYMSSEGAAFRSNDAGRRWSLILGEVEPPAGATFRSVAVSPHDPARAWIGGDNAFFQAIVWSTVDGGETWTPAATTPNVDNVIFAVAADPSVADRVWAGTRSGVLRSDDGGETWSYALFDDRALFVQSIAFASGEIIAASHRLGGTDPALFRSPDDGETWEEIPVPESLPGLRVVIPDADGNLIIGTTGAGVWHLSR